MHESALVLFQLRLEALEQGERIGGAAGKAGQDAVLRAVDLITR